MTVQERVRKFIIEELRWEGSEAELSPEFPLLQTGVLNSMGVYELVSFLEEEYGVEIPEQEVVPENFGTLNGIARLVASRGKS